jgi:geranyl-CoA carboxylase alpha subunit
LRIAAGEPLPLAQDEALARYECGGHAIEARLCAEDPARDYVPQSGTLRHWQPPRSVRCDHALASGCVVGPFYDSMLAKLIAHAPQGSAGPPQASLSPAGGGRREAAASGRSLRVAAIHQLADALDRTVCLGLTTNRGFLARVLRHPAFAGEAVSTAFLSEHFPDNAARASAASSRLRALVAAANAVLAPAAPPALWAGWTSSNHVDTRSPLRIGDCIETWLLSGTPLALTARCGELTHHIAGLARDSRSLVHAMVDGRPLSVRAVHDGTEAWWQCEGIELAVQDLRLVGAAAIGPTAAGALRAPMHGRVTQLPVAAGASVQAGALLLVMEAMKMEHQIVAPFAGRVKALHARIGDQVGARQVLVEIV